jgi:hypothetical protein
MKTLPSFLALCFFACASQIATANVPVNSSLITADTSAIPQRFRVLIPALEKYRGEWPLEFLIAWIKKSLTVVLPAILHWMSAVIFSCIPMNPKH